MTNKEFAFNYAGKEFRYYGDRVILVGYNVDGPDLLIVSPVFERTKAAYWEAPDSSDVITYRTKRTTYQYAQVKELKPVTEEQPQTVARVKPKTPGECIAYFEGQQGMNYSVVNGSVSAVYKRQGSALKLVSWGVEGIINVTAKV